MDHLFNFPKNLWKRRALREQPIPSEKRMWFYLRNRRFHGYKFRRQYGIGGYIVDFYCPKLRLAIEVDGDSHVGRERYDQFRQRWLEKRGMKVVRFNSLDVIHNIEGVLLDLEQHFPVTPPCEGGVGGA